MQCSSQKSKTRRRSHLTDCLHNVLCPSAKIIIKRQRKCRRILETDLDMSDKLKELCDVLQATKQNQIKYKTTTLTYHYQISLCYINCIIYYHVDDEDDNYENTNQNCANGSQ